MGTLVINLKIGFKWSIEKKRLIRATVRKRPCAAAKSRKGQVSGLIKILRKEIEP
jgi:hypothetical protein